jgi:hypothetical protein
MALVASTPLKLLALANTEKEPGMFGTLVVQLPVEGGHTGGPLEIKGPNGSKHVWKTEKVKQSWSRRL